MANESFYGDGLGYAQVGTFLPFCISRTAPQVLLRSAASSAKPQLAPTPPPAKGCVRRCAPQSTNHETLNVAITHNSPRPAEKNKEIQNGGPEGRIEGIYLVKLSF